MTTGNPGSYHLVTWNAKQSSGLEEFKWFRREHEVQCQEDHGEVSSFIQVRMDRDLSEYQIVMINQSAIRN